MGISELEYFLHGVLEMKISALLPLAENAWDEEGCSRFVLLDTRRGKDVADARTWKKR